MRLATILACLMVGACDVAPPRDRQAEAEQQAAEHSQLRNAIQQPIDRAKAANEPNVQADEDRRKAIEDAGD